jgi:hypothetical protein
MTSLFNFKYILRDSMSNLNFIANTLYNMHGVPKPFTEIQRMLCDKNNKVWNRGKYCAYFSGYNGYGVPTKPGGPVLWERVWEEGKLLGWVLTTKGHKYVTVTCNS